MTWAEKMEMAMHTGNVGSPYRKKVAAVAEKHPAEMLVNELFIGASALHGQRRKWLAAQLLGVSVRRAVT